MSVLCYNYHWIRATECRPGYVLNTHLATSYFYFCLRSHLDMLLSLPSVDVQFWADPLVWGYDHRAADASECCASCHAYNAAVERGGTDKGTNSSRCNTWAFCADKEICKDRLGECW
jgi:hypothetical protein